MTVWVESAALAEAGFSGERMRHLRKVRGLSVDALGAAIGNDGAYVSRLERGLGGEPTPAKQRLIAKALEVRVGDLQEPDGEVRSDVQAVEAALVRLGWSPEDIRSTMRQVLLLEAEHQRKKRKR